MFRKIISQFKKGRILPRAWKRLLSYFYFEQWIILLAQVESGEKPTWKDFKRLPPPPDRIWADPFIWTQENKYYVFIEEMPFSTNRGHISCLTFDRQLNLLSNDIVLERQYHLSYPFLFEYDGELYMLPETGENRSIEAYRCTQFPNKWKFAKTLIPDIHAVDATLLEANGKWWLFASMANEDGIAWDTLNLYYADHPLSDSWTPHPCNPIVRDIRLARPAGEIFSRDGYLIRPSQDCFSRYGYATNFNRILKLTESDYAETCEATFTPPRLSRLISTHTWSTVEGLTAIDAVMLRRKTNAR
jgi:hypothetical protein